jgi:hypothetical protein
LVQDQRTKGQESRGIGDEPTNSTEGSETPGGVARQSEGIAEREVLHAVRQGVSSRCAGRGLRAVPQERRRGGRRWAEVRGHRGIRGAEVAGRTGARAQRQEVSSARRAASLHSKAGRQTTPVGDTNGERPRSADGGSAGLGADLRGRSAAGAIRLSSQPQRTGRGGQSAQFAAHGTFRTPS